MGLIYLKRESPKRSLIVYPAVRGTEGNHIACSEAGPEVESAAVFDGAALTATITWAGTTGAGADQAFAIIYDNASKRVAYAVEVARSAGTVTLDAAAFANVSSYSDIYAYLAFYNIHPDGSGVNSDTTAFKATKDQHAVAALATAMKQSRTSP
jgi:hypothetical protein